MKQTKQVDDSKSVIDKIIFYTRPSCGLCKEAYEILKNELKDTREIEIHDISLNDAETERFGLMIPVVEYKGEIIAYGRIHKKDILKRFY